MSRPKRNLVLSDNPGLITPEILQEVRETALRERLHISETIAELTKLADEIDATLKFLKAQRGDT